MISNGNWVRAFNLRERAGGAGPADFAAANFAPALAAWRAEAPFDREPWLEQRLAQDGLDERSFAALAGLGEDELWRRLGPVPCAERLAQAFAVPAPPSGLAAGAFAPLIQPLVDQAAARLRRFAEGLAARSDARLFAPAEVPRLFWEGVGGRLDWMLSRAAVLELQVARLEDRLHGDTPAERFDHFVAELATPPRVLEFFAEYSVLARCVVEALDRWVEVSGELLERLAADHAEIAAAFGGGARLGRLARVSGGAGDLHCGGRAVRLLSFDSGFRVVYKPRPIEIHRRFAELLRWLDERGAPGLVTVRSLPRPGYGWLEFVAPEPCREEGGLELFYRRQGAFLAIFYLLNATDFHRENLIACGEHPIFVDLECLLCPDYGLFEPASHDSLAHFEMYDSVMRVMLLPFFHANASQVYDPSGLGGQGGQESVNEVPVWLDSGTDRMRLGKERQPIGEAQNRPSLAGGGAAGPLEHRGALRQGFADTYRLLERHRAELLAPGSPLDRFADAEVRVVLRASQFYAFILDESYHPDFLRDAFDRDRHFDRLWYGIDRTRFAPVSLAVLPLERQELWRGDIPLFSAKAGSRDLRAGGGELLPDLLARSGLDLARARLARLSEEDLARQLWYLDASLAALTIKLDAGGLSPFRPLLRPQGGQRERALEAAAKVADRLGELAMEDQRHAAWTGLAQTRSRGWWLRPLDLDLYSGLPGVALFLAHSGEILGRPQDTRLARLALANLDRQLERRKGIQTVGAFDGWGGLIHLWLHLARLWNDKALMLQAIAALPALAEAVEHDQDLDVVRGGAGGIPPLLALHRETGDPAALALAARMGDRLLEKAQVLELAAGTEQEGALCWRTASFPAHPLTGFSHGNSGIAWALVQLSAATGEERYREAARRALLFEKFFFSPRAGNWLDLRSVTAGPGSADYGRHRDFSVSWCHGATGIGLARLRMAEHLEREEMLHDARLALAAVLKDGFGICHCLCHGDLGNLELLYELAAEPGFEGIEGKIEEQANRLFEDMEKRGMLCGVPYYVETPGLMDGLAGIGYGLLRLAEREKVPSVLLLDLPASS